MFLQVTITSVVSVILFSFCFAILLEIVLGNDKLLSKIKYELLLICMAAPIIKIIVPIEVLPWTRNIAVTHVLPDVVKLINKEVIVVAENKVTLWNLVLGVMTAGAFVKAVVIVCSYMHFRRNVCMLPDVNDSGVQKLADKILKQKGRNSSIALKWLDGEESPKISGFLRMYILLPRKELSETELECILRHEIAHYVHGDMIIRLGWIIIKIICWWNPAVYMLDKQFEKLLEIRADENAVKNVDSDICCDYMETLVNMARGMKSTKKGSAYCASFQEKNGIPVRRRVKLMLDREKRSRSTVLISNFVSVICLITLTVAMNVYIFEPKGELPEVENYEGSKVLSSDDSFLIINECGTYDLYYNGKYRLTMEDDMGTNYPVYKSLEEALRYEELK